MIDELEHPGCEQGQSRSVDGLPVWVITNAQNLRMLRVIDIKSEVVTCQHPVETRRDELIKRNLSTGNLTLKLVLCSTVESI